jgi:hypothetical protein
MHGKKCINKALKIHGVVPGIDSEEAPQKRFAATSMESPPITRSTLKNCLNMA